MAASVSSGVLSDSVASSVFFSVTASLVSVSGASVICGSVAGASVTCGSVAGASVICGSVAGASVTGASVAGASVACVSGT